MTHNKIRTQRSWFSLWYKRFFNLGYLLISSVLVVLFMCASYTRNEFWLQDEIGIWENVAKGSPAKFRPHYNLSREYDKKGRYVESERELLIAISLEPDSAKVYNNLGWIYGQENRFEDAVKELKIAIRLDPNYYLAYRNLQAAYESLGEFDEAETARKNADAIYHYEQGRSLAELGNLKEAIKELQISIILWPDNEAANRELIMLRTRENIMFNSKH